MATYFTPNTSSECEHYELTYSFISAYQKSFVITFYFHATFALAELWAELLLASVRVGALSPRGRSVLAHVLGRALWRGFCVEGMTCLKRQCHCDASGLHLCMLSLFFRKVSALQFAVGNGSPAVLLGCHHRGLQPVSLHVPVGLIEVLHSDG